MKLENRVAVVTGAGSGLGREISRRFAAEGARIAAVDLRAETAEETISLCEGSGHFATGVDVSDPDSVREMFSKYFKRLHGYTIMRDCGGHIAYSMVKCQSKKSHSMIRCATWWCIFRHYFVDLYGALLE